MADTKISALTAASTLGGTEELAGVQSAANVKITPAQIKTYAESNPIALAPPSLTGSAATTSLGITQTWNTTGTPTALKLDVTNTASNAASLLMDLRVGGTSRFSFANTGAFSFGQAGSSLPLLATNSGTLNFSTNFTVVFSTGQVFLNGSSQNTVQVGGVLCIGQTGTSCDTLLYRDAANTLALRNSTNAQEFRWSYSWTDASNRQGGALKTASDQIIIEAQTAGTGADNLDVTLTPAGTGAVRFGTHSAVAAETVTGYITIKDAGGTTRKLAVVS